MRQRHPGKVVFVDATAGTEREELAETVPESIAFARDGEGWIPVVRVVATLHGDERTLHSYAADGTLVATTHQVRRSEP